MAPHGEHPAWNIRSSNVNKDPLFFFFFLLLLLSFSFLIQFLFSQLGLSSTTVRFSELAGDYLK